MRARLAVIGLAVLGACLAPGWGVSAADDKVSHKGWPEIDGVLRMNSSRHGAVIHGTSRNDELLGGPGWNRIFGQDGDDVIWGDFRPYDQPASQRDHLYGGPGHDFLYASHGANFMHGGRGNDVLHAHFGRGLVDCGTGNDLVYISHRSRPRYHLVGCERISFKTERQRRAQR